MFIQRKRLLPGAFDAFDIVVGLNDLGHLGLDGLKIGLIEVDAGHVVIEPLVGRRADGEFRVWIQSLERLRENVRRGVAYHLEVLVRLVRDDDDAIAVAHLVDFVHQFTVDDARDRVRPESRADLVGYVRDRGPLGHGEFGAIGQRDRHLAHDREKSDAPYKRLETVATVVWARSFYCLVFSRQERSCRFMPPAVAVRYMAPQSEESTPRVLLAEDEVELASLYESWLQTTYDATTVYDGDAALEAYDGHDVVLLDRMMPGHEGDEVLSILRDRGVDAPVAMVTAVDPGPDIADMPFDEYVCKPVERGELLNLVDVLYRRATYDDKLRRHYALASKLATLESHVPAEELAESPAYAELEAEFTSLEAALTDTGGELSDDDLTALLREGQ